MALFLVPYNNAMRLGQGFNSFTHEICLDNAVVGVSDEEDTQPIIPVGFQISTPQDIGNGSVKVGDKASLEQFTANLALKTRLHNPSQIVTYSSKFVDKLSDVADELNVSGSLSIRYGEISGGGGGSYVNAHTFQSSDVNFLITVKVLNQTINTKDQLMFWPLDKEDATNMNDERFTKVYGDSFISGFQEGGMFTALVSIRSTDNSDKLTIKANAHLALQVGVGEVKADADFTMAKAKLDKSTEINITVNWSGGGQLKEGSETWSVETLQGVAVRFADLVSACPQRTHAILTKYTSLRSYINWARGKQLRPLDYEIAALYTSELLDVYMGYKTIWKDIHVMMQQLDAGLIELVKAPEPSTPIVKPLQETTTIAADSNGNVTRGKATYAGQKASDKLSAFTPDYVGLDLALKVCRELMVRIVDENNRITDDPKLAIDPDRNVVYIRPQVFRSLLPMRPAAPRLTFRLWNWSLQLSGTDTTFWNVSQFIQPQIVAGVTRFELERVSPLSFQITHENPFRPQNHGSIIVGDTRSSKNINHPIGITCFAIPANDEGIHVGRCELLEPNPGSADKAQNKLWRQKVGFPYAYDERPPTVIVFLTSLQMDSKGPTNISVKANSITNDSFEVVARGLDTMTKVAASWIAVPAEIQGVRGGSTETSWAPGLSEEKPKSDLRPYAVVSDHVRFLPKSFKGTPTILAWLSGFSISDGTQDIHLDLRLTEQTKRGFNWAVFCTDGGSYLTGASISWLAFENP